MESLILVQVDRVLFRKEVLAHTRTPLNTRGPKKLANPYYPLSPHRPPEPYEFPECKPRDPNALQKLFVIAEECHRKRARFTDPDFPPRNDSVFFHRDGTEPANHDPFLCSLTDGRGRPTLTWLRPTEIVSQNSYVVLPMEPHPNDVFVGILEDAYLISAFRELARRGMLGGVILDQYLPWGVIGVNLFVFGKWHVIIIDDLLPCHETNTAWVPVFSTPSGDHSWNPAADPEAPFWGMLMEKAFAKLHGSYQALSDGVAGDVISYVTGCLLKHVHLWGDEFVTADAGAKLFEILHDVVLPVSMRSPKKIPDPLTDITLWGALHNTMAFCSGNAPDVRNIGKVDSGTLREVEDGLTLGSSYPVLACSRVNKHRVVGLNDFRGLLKRTGEWSVHSRQWNPQARTTFACETGFLPPCGLGDDHDRKRSSLALTGEVQVTGPKYEGVTSCMPYREFLLLFSSLDLCGTPPTDYGFHRSFLKGSWKAGQSAGGPVDSVFRYNPTWTITTAATSVVVSVEQPDPRAFGHNATGLYLYMCKLSEGSENPFEASLSGVTNVVFSSERLNTFVIPIPNPPKEKNQTTTCLLVVAPWRSGVEGRFWIHCYTNVPALLKRRGGKARVDKASVEIMEKKEFPETCNTCGVTWTAFSEGWRTWRNIRWHNKPECYCCSRCQESFTSTKLRDVEYRLGKWESFCEKCYVVSQGVRCIRCEKLIDGEYCVVGDSDDKFHPRCFEEHMKTTSTPCAYCQQPICPIAGVFTGRAVMFSGGYEVHEECAENYQNQAAARCDYCLEPIRPVRGKHSGTYVLAPTGGKLHEECFDAFMAQYDAASKEPSRRPQPPLPQASHSKLERRTDSGSQKFQRPLNRTPLGDEESGPDRPTHMRQRSRRGSRFRNNDEDSSRLREGRPPAATSEINHSKGPEKIASVVERSAPLGSQLPAASNTNDILLEIAANDGFDDF
eukprot:Rmarinus@m.4088